MPTAAEPTLATAPNFRDLGGWPTADGGEVRRSLVFRSEALLLPTEADAERLAAHGIMLVCDLRSDDERAHAPNAFWAERGVERLDLDLLAGIPDRKGPWRILAERPDAAGAEAAMRSVYEAMPEASLAHVATLFRRIAAGDLPLLIHCTAGKDRTGFLSALLLTALGVAREHVLADYLASQGRRTERATEATRAMVLARAGTALEPAALEAMMGVDAAYLDATFAVLDANYGGAAGYLARAGLDEASVRRVRERLVG